MEAKAKISINKKLQVQNSASRDNTEALLHNLLFQQGSNDPSKSDLWIINEEFIYFKGTSESRLADVKLDGKRIFKDTFTQEEERYLKSLGENRKLKRPDVLLFPDEGKCIILEFKNPEVNVSDHLNQINKYATWIRNYTTLDFQIFTFYGYLIGEAIEPNDVRAYDGDFTHAHQFDYLFRPSKTIVDFESGKDGSLYMEVLKYSNLLERAKKRNEIFLNKLLEGDR